MEDKLKVTVNGKIIEFTKEKKRTYNHLWESLKEHFNAVYGTQVMQSIPYDWSREEVEFLIDQMICLYTYGQADGHK